MFSEDYILKKSKDFFGNNSVDTFLFRTTGEKNSVFLREKTVIRNAGGKTFAWY